MAIFDVFFRRQRRARKELPGVFVYDQLPERLRAQIVYILQDLFRQRSAANALVL